MLKTAILVIITFFAQTAIAQNTADIVAKNTEFAIDLYKQLAKSNSNKNLFFSPYSISEAVALTYAGASNNTEKQMQKVLHFLEKQEDLHKGLSELKMALTNNTDSVTLKIANSLWAQKDYVFKPEYLSLVQTKYNAPSYSVNFKKPNLLKQAVSDINTWVEKNTDNQIKELVKNDDVSEETRLILINAIWFYGEWLSAFNEKSSQENVFKSIKGEQATVFMSQKGKYLYYDDDIVTAVQIPYKGNKQSMVILLPVNNAGISALEKNFDTEYVSNILGDMREVNLRLKIPKFTAEYSVDLKKTLLEMGMVEAFSNGADFSNMTDKNDLKIDKILHKAKIEVSEKGTKATAATAVVMVRKTAIMDELVFNADHPFIYMIRHNETGTILFLGKFVTVE
jgi:serpin B